MRKKRRISLKRITFVLCCLVAASGLVMAGCFRTKPLAASSLDDPESLTVPELLQTVSLKTAQAFPDGFVLRKTTAWPGLVQVEKTMVLPGEPSYEILCFDNQDNGIPMTLRMTRTEGNRQQILAARRIEQGWEGLDMFDRNPVHSPAQDIPAWVILDALSLDSFSIPEKYPALFCLEAQSEGNAVSWAWHPMDEQELRQAVSDDQQLHKLGNPYFSQFSETLETSREGVLTWAAYHQAATESTAERTVEITVSDEAGMPDRDLLEGLFSVSWKQGDMLQLPWADAFAA